MAEERRVNCVAHDDMLREVRDDVRGLVGTVGEIRTDVAVLKAGHAGVIERVGSLSKRVGDIEAWKYRIVGAVMAAALVGGGTVMAWAKKMVP